MMTHNVGLFETIRQRLRAASGRAVKCPNGLSLKGHEGGSRGGTPNSELRVGRKFRLKKDSY